MTFEWSPQLAVGIEVIDAQHRELFRRVDRFVNALAEQASAAETMHLLGFLGEYVVTHFADEEALMAEHAYPGTGAHAAEHARFTATFEELRNEFARLGTTPKLAEAVEREVCRWLFAHVGGTDRALADFVRGSAPAGLEAVNSI